MLKILSVFAALNLCTTVAMAAGRVVPSRSVADSVRSEETTPNTAERAGQSKNSRGVATREVPKVVAREGAKSNENSAGANARRGANADSDSRTTNARTQRSATATRSVANARGGATAAKSTATATASRVATTNVARTANRSVKSDVAKGVRASVTGLYTGFTPPPPQGRSVTTARVATKRQSMVPGAASSSRATRARATVQGQAEIEKIIENLTTQSSLKKSCQEQYTECMDQFCNTLDEKQGRCSCSANLSRYAKSEEAVKEANARLNEVAQNIRYIGLSADEIRSIMSETEAESALAGTADTSETRNMLDKIEDLIRDPTSSNSYVADNFTDFTLDLDFTSDDNDDLFSLDFFNMGNSSSFSNLRGTDLYKAAKKRCNSILTQCKQAGATSELITGNYDLAIDKDCLAYEQGLQKMNDSLTSNVRSATQMLQKARLAVRQNKNQYDAKGCVAALDKCMTDDMVCGADYFKCVDPTKNFIDEKGEVILGQDITKIIGFMKNYNNAKIDDDFLDKAYSQVVSVDICAADKGVNSTSGNNDGSCIAKYLLQKIGTKQNVTDEGLCRAVLDKCQNYTYDKNGNYKRFNDVVVNYVQRAMVNINAAQRQIISDYASSCITDIASCYNQQVSQVNTWSSNASVANIQRVMSGACRNVALTCAYAVFDGDEKSCSSADKCIENISQMFYQSLLCPDNSVYQTTASSTFGNGTSYVNAHCMCANGYKAQGSACVENGTGGTGGNGGGTTEQPEDGTDDVTPIKFSVYDATLGQVVETVTVEAYGAQVVDIVKYLQNSSVPVTKVTIKRDGLKYIVTADNDDVDWVSICTAAGATRVNSSCEVSLEKTVAFGGTCTVTAECSTTNAVCTSNKCACKLWQEYSPSSNSCGNSGGNSGGNGGGDNGDNGDDNPDDEVLGGGGDVVINPVQYGGACVSASQCKTTNAICNGVCSCASGNKYESSTDSCVTSSVVTGNLGESCRTDSDCKIGYSVCANNVCACGSGYEQSGSTCVASQGGSGTNPPSGSVDTASVLGHGDLGAPCRGNLNVGCLARSSKCSLSSGLCECEEGYHQVGLGCIADDFQWPANPEPGMLGASCTLNQLIPCSKIVDQNTECLNNVCACPEGYAPSSSWENGGTLLSYRCVVIDDRINKDGKGTVQVGGICSKHSDCAGPKTACMGWRCECYPGAYWDDNVQQCIALSLVSYRFLGESCVRDDNIYDPNAKCSGGPDWNNNITVVGTVVCKDGYTPIGGKCVLYTGPESSIPGRMGGACSTTSDCLDSNSVCGSGGICMCAKGYVSKADGTGCVYDNAQYTSSAAIAKAYGAFGKDAHRTIGGACRYAVGESINHGCVDRNSHCTPIGICACNTGYSSAATGTCQKQDMACPDGQVRNLGKCYEYGDGVLEGTTCRGDLECPENAWCANRAPNSATKWESQKCVCESDSYEINGKCVLPVARGECNMSCPDNGKCYSGAIYFENGVEKNIYHCDCQINPDYSMTSPGVCTKEENYTGEVQWGWYFNGYDWVVPSLQCPWGWAKYDGGRMASCYENRLSCGNYCSSDTDGTAVYDLHLPGGITDPETQCPSTEEIMAEFASVGWNWTVVRKLNRGRFGTCGLIVKSPDDMGGLCFQVSTSGWIDSDIGEDGLPTEWTYVDTKTQNGSNKYRLTVCDSTYHQDTTFFMVVINDDDFDVKVPQVGKELRHYTQDGSATVDSAFRMTVPYSISKPYEYPGLEKWVDMVERLNPDRCFLGGKFRDDGTSVWDKTGAKTLDVLPAVKINASGYTYRFIDLLWGKRDNGECD